MKKKKKTTTESVVMKGVLSMAFVPLRNIYGEHLRENVRFPIKRGGEIYEIYDTSYSISTYPYQ